MKSGIHPDYHPVVFVDKGAGFEFVSRCTMKTRDKREIDGVEHYVIRLDISSASHPFFTGKQRFVDTAGRIDKFRSKYGKRYGRPRAEGAEGAAADDVAPDGVATDGAATDGAAAGDAKPEAS